MSLSAFSFGHFAAQPLNPQLLRLHLAITGKSLNRICSKIPNPFAQHILVNLQIAGGLSNSNTPLTHQTLPHLTAPSLNSSG